MTSISTVRRIGAFAAVVALAVSMGACSTGTTSTSTSSASSSSAATSNKATTATSLADFGTIDDLYAAAKAEGALNVIAVPHDWANYGKMIDAFKAKYPGIEINEALPNGSSAEEIAAAKTNKGLNTAPDVFDLGAAVAMSNTDIFAPYKVATWKDIPDMFKESTGLYTGDYGGYMSVGVDTSKYQVPATIQNLMNPEYKGAVAINGDPTQAGAAFAAVGLATILNGGTLDSFQPGIDFFSQMNKDGNFIKIDPTPATITSGETPVVFDWDYNNAAQAEKVPGWKTVVFPDKGYAGYYYQAINIDAPHPAAARLWQEFLYSDQGQNIFLGGYARPVRMEAMTTAGTIDKEAAALLPPAPKETVVPTQDQNKAASDLLGQKWAAALG